MERATLLEELSKAFVMIGDVLPRADLGAELYQTEYMIEALSQLYAYIIRFLHLCLRWYSRSSLGRLFSSVRNPFKLEYQDLVEYIEVCSTNIETLANAGARVEVRDISVTQALHHAQFMDLYSKLLKRYDWVERSVTQILQLSTSNKALIENMNGNVCEIKRTSHRTEFHSLVQFLAPDVSPAIVLLKARSFARRNPTMTLAVHGTVKVKRKLHAWAMADQSSLLVIRMGARAQSQARQLTVEIIEGLSKTNQSVFWVLSLPVSSDWGGSVANVFKNIIHQALQHSTGLFTQYAEQLNLEKIHCSHTDSEWVDLICLLFSNIPDAFIVVETGDLHKMNRHDAEWASRLLRLLQKVVDHTSAAGNRLKVLLVVYENVLNTPDAASKHSELSMISLPRPAPIPPRMRHMARRSGLNTKGWTLSKPKIC